MPIVEEAVEPVSRPRRIQKDLHIQNLKLVLLNIGSSAVASTLHSSMFKEFQNSSDSRYNKAC